MSDPAVEPLVASALATAEAESATHRSALDLQCRRLEDRDRRIVDAVRAGADLERIATAASVTRAAVSLVARREIRARPGRGGPYARSRGVERALAAVADATRAIWATALYAGLRLGELKALRVADVDLEGGRIDVERSWDVKEGVIETKSRSGRRRVPIAEELRAHLAEHLLRTGRREGLVFGRTEERPFAHVTLRDRAHRAWEAAGLQPIGFHECRHTFASMCIAAGVNARALMAYLGHSSIQMTFDRYGHLMPGNESEAARLLDDYLRRSRLGRPVEGS